MSQGDDSVDIPSKEEHTPRMKKYTFGIFLLLFCGLSLSPSILHAETPDHEPPIRIGVILPLTGDAASWGEAVRNGVELAREKLPVAIRDRIELVYEDDQRNPRLSVLAFQKLVQLNHISALIGITAQPGMAVAPLAEREKIPFISISLPKRITQDRQYSVLLYPTTERMGQALADEAKSRGYKRIARISSIHDGRMSIREAFDAAHKGAIEIALDEDYPIESRDFKEFLIKLKSLPKIDAIYANLVLGQVGLFAKQARELNIQLPLFESEMFEDDSEVALSQGALVGQWFVNQVDAPREFLQEYQQRFPGARVFNASNGFDALNLLLASRSPEELSTERARETLNQAIHPRQVFHGVLGKYPLGADNRFDIPVAVKEVLPRGYKTLRTFSGSPVESAGKPTELP